MSTDTNTFDGLIAEWGIANFAAALGVSYSTANAMKQRNAVPAKYWPRVVSRAPARLELTPPRILEIEALSAQVRPSAKQKARAA